MGIDDFRYNSKKFFGGSSFTVMQIVEIIENYAFNYLAVKNPGCIYFLKSFIIFFLGTFIPGYVFMVVESHLEKEFKQKTYPQLQRGLIYSIYDVIDKEEEFQKVFSDYESKIVEYFKLYPLIMLNLNVHIWDLWVGFFYSYTVYTTLGYGEIYPLSTVGRILTMLYALVSIPLFLLFLRDLGKLFTLLVKYVWRLIRRMYYTGSCRKFKKYSAKEDAFIEKKVVSELMVIYTSQKSTARTPAYSNDSSDQELSTFEIDDEFNLPIPVALFILCAYIFLGAILYSYFEGWEFFDAFYYVFTCLSTIGFGDFIPHHPTCEILSLFYECFGKAFMAMTIDLFAEKFSHSFEHSLKSDSDLYDMDDSGSDRSYDLDTTVLDKDQSVQNIIHMEEREEASLGIKRVRSRLQPSRYRSDYFTTLKNDQVAVSVVGDRRRSVVGPGGSEFMQSKVEEIGGGDYDVDVDVDVDV